MTKPHASTRRSTLAIATALALLAHGCGRRSPAPLGPEADAGAGDANVGYVGVPQSRLSVGAPSVTHPTRPLLGQLVDGECLVWDLEQGVFRGTVPEAECAAWAPDAGAPPDEVVRSAPGDLGMVRGRPDASGRYLVFTGTRTLGPSGAEQHVDGILSLQDGDVRAIFPRPPDDDLVSSTVRWKRDGRGFFVSLGPLSNYQSCAPTGLAVRDVDVATGAVSELSVGDGEVTAAEPSPDGRMLLFGTEELGECVAAPPTPENRGVIARVRLWAPERSPALRWTFDARLAAVAWSPSSKAVALAVGAAIQILGVDHESGDPPSIASWPGKPPIVWSPDGSRVASREGVELAVRDARTWSRVAAVGIAAVAAAWGPTGTLAVADERGVALRRTDLPGAGESFELPRVDALVWSPSGARLCARSAKGMFVIEAARLREQPRALGDRSLSDGICSWVSDGEIVVRRPLEVHRFSAQGAGWSDAVVSVKWWDRVDASGRFEAGPETILRLADGEVLHDPRGALWTESFLYATTPPEGWVFRAGPDVLGGRMIRAKDASFLRPTPDLAERFLSGAALPRRQ